VAELRELQRKLESTKALREIVNAMRNLAAIYMRRAERTLEAIRPYSAVVETALRVVLERAGAPEFERDEQGPCVALVFAGDQGLCGAYNQRVVRAAREFAASAAGPVDFVAIGLRAHSLLRMQGTEAILSVPSPSSLEGIRAHVPELASSAFNAYLETGATEMVFVYSAYAGMGRFREHVRPVLPPRPEQLAEAQREQFRAAPILTAPAGELLGALIEEYFFIQLYRALLESHASENGARLVAMTSASSNIDDALASLTKQFQSLRQDAITAEMLDVVSGAEALAQVP